MGLLIAFTATPVRAQPKAAEAKLPINAVAALQSTPIVLSLPPVASSQSTPLDLSLHLAAAPQSRPIDLAMQSASPEVKGVAGWVIATGDNVGLPFVLIDKVNAQVFVFSPAGQLQGSAPVLLGMARGDRMLAPNDAKMAQMPPQVRITPAGRFVSRLARDSHGKELLVLDYEASLSLHPVVKGTPVERRAERLKSATAQDNRVSFGCINVPVPFYTTIVSPAFTGTKGIVYVLPETSSVSALFGLQTDGAVVSGPKQSSTALDTPAAQLVPAPVAR